MDNLYGKSSIPKEVIKDINRINKALEIIYNAPIMKLPNCLKIPKVKVNENN